MKLGKAELPVVLLLAALAAAAASFSADHLLAPPALGVLLRGAPAAPVAAAFWLGVTSLCGAMILCIGWVLPAVRRQSKEQGKLQSLTGLLKQRSQDLERAASTDALTGMHNRRFFDEALREYIAAFAQVGRPLGLVIIDLDRFKAINDSYGHDVGDEVLKAVAVCLFEFTRFHDVVARLGGEEFAVMAPNMDMPALRRFADRMREAIEALIIEVGGRRVPVTASLGLAVTQGGDDSAALFKRADVNLYLAKHSGRNRVCA
ncbi:GGDEF domain-containing protein [Jiella sp. M17.18]|uniref:GGDEF domain-containing protein n=1 Tax=Jiella sp. M17.18 TaxID=3234247 RepID=UPI0034DE2234